MTTHRRLLTWAALLCLTNSPSNAQDMQLWYDKPASQWVEAIPLGNGRLGAMVFGGVQQKRLQLNEESLWAGQPVDSYPDDFQDNLKILQDLVLAGKTAEASDFGQQYMVRSPLRFALTNRSVTCCLFIPARQ